MAYVDNHPGEANYYSSIRNYKMANAANTKRKNWIASDDRAQEIIDFVFDQTKDNQRKKTKKK